MKKYSISFLILLTGIVANAQESIPIVPTARRVVPASRLGTILQTPFDKKDLDKIVDLRIQFERQNQNFSRPFPPPQSFLQFLNKDKLQLSAEARYWINLGKDSAATFDENMTFKDTIIVNPLFMPLVLNEDTFPGNLILYDKNYLKTKTFYKSPLPKDTIFSDLEALYAIREKAFKQIKTNYPDQFLYSYDDMPNDFIKPKKIRIDLFEQTPLAVEKEASFDDVEAPVKFIPERKYWQSSFESAIQFSQNYISENWHKGGTSNLNLFTKNNLSYNYQKDKIQIVNRIDVNTSVNNAPKDTLRSYKVGGDDLLRIQSTFGYKAYNKWYYTFDTEFRTAIFNSYTENSYQKQAALLAPLQLNVGLGMKYELNKTFTRKDRNFSLNINMAPISYTYKYSRIKEEENLDLGRHGFEKDPETGQYKNTLSSFGSTIKANFTVNFNKNVSWQSRILYNTSYDKVEAEFENTLVMAISRFFSTRIFIYARYDDSASEKDKNLGYFQINELLSFGFNYKW